MHASPAHHHAHGRLEPQPPQTTVPTVGWSPLTSPTARPTARTHRVAVFKSMCADVAFLERPPVWARSKALLMSAMWIYNQIKTFQTNKISLGYILTEVMTCHLS